MEHDQNSYLVDKQLIYEANWHTYEEWGGIRIYGDNSDDVFYVELGGHSVYSDPGQPDWEEPYVANMEHVLDLIDEWTQIEKDNEDYWEHNGGF